jgi:prephenate dehydrogenase
MTVAIVGIGLIGGSLAVDLRKRKFAEKIIGVDSSLHHQNIAKLCGLVDDIATLEDAIDKSELIILSTPVSTNCKMLPSILDRIKGTSKVQKYQKTMRQEAGM